MSRRHGTAANANTTGHDQWDRPDDAWSISQRSLNSARITSSSLTTFARIAPVRGEYRYLYCFGMPVPSSACVAISEMGYALVGSAAASILLKDKPSQVNRQDAPNVIRVAVLRRAIGYAAGRPLRVSGRTSCGIVPVGGISMSMSNGKHRLPHRNNSGRRYHRRAISPCPGGHSAPPDLRHLRSQPAARPSPLYFRSVHCQITIPRSSDIDDHRQPVNSAASRDSRDSTAGLPAAARRQRERNLTDA